MRRDDAHPQTLRLIGELDLDTRDVLAAALGEAVRPGRDLVVDCARLDFIDAAGLAVLMRTAKMIGDGRLRLVGVQSHLAGLIDLLGLRAAVPNLRVDNG